MAVLGIRGLYIPPYPTTATSQYNIYRSNIPSVPPVRCYYVIRPLLEINTQLVSSPLCFSPPCCLVATRATAARLAAAAVHVPGVVRARRKASTVADLAAPVYCPWRPFDGAV